MANKKMIFAASIALAVGVLAGCGTAGVSEDRTNGSGGKVKADTEAPAEIAAKFHSTIETKNEGNDTIINYKVKNISGVAKKLTFPTGLQVDYIVYDENHKKVKQYSDEVASTQAIQEVTLQNNEEITKEFRITGLTGEKYTIEVFLTSKEEEAKVVTDVIIDKSTKGTGVYVGQIDPHTIEVDINGNKTAFQLTDTAINQLNTFKEGESVSFDYVENKNGQKVIQQFYLNK